MGVSKITLYFIWGRGGEKGRGTILYKYLHLDFNLTEYKYISVLQIATHIKDDG